MVVLGKRPVPEVNLLIWIIVIWIKVGLAEGAGGCFFSHLTFFSLVNHFSLLPLSGRCPDVD